MEKRKPLNRVGIVLLNLIAPGLGLLGLGRWRAALSLYAPALVSLLWLSFGPAIPFLVLAVIFIIVVGAYLVSMGWSWIASRASSAQRPWYARWYAITAVALAVLVMNFVGTSDDRAFRSFYLPAEGMAPTLEKNDRFIAHMSPPDELRRGDLVLIVAGGPDDIYVKRVAALPGDRIAVRDGVVLLNRVPVRQQLIGDARVRSDPMSKIAHIYRERFPGEASPHQIYDTGESAGDDFGETRVRPGHIFVLGDNRDRSADSRFSKDLFGLEQVPIEDVVGRSLYHSWRSSSPMGALIK